MIDLEWIIPRKAMTQYIASCNNLPVRNTGKDMEISNEPFSFNLKSCGKAAMKIHFLAKISWYAAPGNNALQDYAMNYRKDARICIHHRRTAMGSISGKYDVLTHERGLLNLKESICKKH